MIVVAIEYAVSGVRFKQQEIVSTVKAAYRVLGVKDARVNVAFLGDHHMKRLNAEYRDMNKPTDVLSFPAQTNHKPEGSDKYVGDILLGFPYVTAQAHAKKVSSLDEVRMLLIHGILHLAGYDHETDRDEISMFTLQNQIAKKIGAPIVDPRSL